MNSPSLSFLIILSGLVCLSSPLHAENSQNSPYRLSPEILADGQYELRPYRLSQVKTDDKRPYAQQIALAAQAEGLDPELIHAVIAVESAYQATAISPKGAVGLMQLMPETAHLNGSEQPAEVTANLRAGTRHLKRLLARFDNSLELALAAYNAGEGAVRRHGNSIPPYPETRNYVPAVITRYRTNNLAATSAIYRKNTSGNYLSGTRLAQ